MRKVNYLLTMEQLLLKMDDTSDVKVLASSAYNFRIELVRKIGKDDDALQPRRGPGKY